MWGETNEHQLASVEACTVLVAPTVTGLALRHQSVLLARVWALTLETVQTKRAGQ